MTTQSWSSRVRHDSDATYREWRDELITRLAAAGLGVAETNITAGAGTRPGASTEQGYAVFYLNDSLHATSPIYMRFGFGTHPNATTPRIQVTLGTATDGAGNISGAGHIITAIGASVASQTNDTVRQSYACSVAGLFWLNWKTAASCEASFFVCRSCDTDGTPNGDGSLAHYGVGSSSNLNRRGCARYIATANSWSTTSQSAAPICIAPVGISESGLGGDLQAFLAWMGIPEIQPVFGVCGIFTGEVTAGSTFTATLLGSTPRTFMALTAIAGPANALTAASPPGLSMALIWE